MSVDTRNHRNKAFRSRFQMANTKSLILGVSMTSETRVASAFGISERLSPRRDLRIFPNSKDKHTGQF